MTYLAISFFITTLLTPIIIRSARRRGWLDQVGGRKVHKSPVPRLGGVGIFAGIGVGWAWLFIFGSGIFTPEIYKQLLFLSTASTLVWLMGLYDDLRGLGAYKKLLVQIIAALIVFMGGIQIRFVGQPWVGGDIFLDSTLVSASLTIFWLVFVTNAINLIDGLDGLAGGVCFITALSLYFISTELGIPHLPPLCLSVTGACFGFLIFNFSPARIFLGDSGALFLGFLLAALSVMGTVKRGAAIVLFGPPLILAVPVLDTLWAVIRRFIRNPRGEPGPTHLQESTLNRIFARLNPRYLLQRLQEIFVADQNHIHHGLLKLGLSHRRAVILLYGLSALMGVSAYRVATSRHLLGVLISGALLVTLLFWALKNLKKR